MDISFMDFTHTFCPRENGQSGGIQARAAILRSCFRATESSPIFGVQEGYGSIKKGA